MSRRYGTAAGLGSVLLLVGPAAQADHHLMQIHKVIGGANGVTAVQAIQLRMRGDGQNFVANDRLLAWDAAGANPVVLMTCDHDVANGAAGARIVLATENFEDVTSPATAPDFVLENRIPDSYLPAGCLTWESEGGIVWWRLCWGGAAYTGPTAVSGLNDPDGDCGPPWHGPLPSTTLQALRFDGLFFADGTTNLADYSLPAGDATFTTNGGTNTTLIAPPTSAPARPTLGTFIVSPNPFRSMTKVAFRLAEAGVASLSVLDVTGRRIAR